MKALKTVMWTVLTVLLVILLLAIIYVGYVFFSYSRIGDKQELEVVNVSENYVKTGESYTILTQNLGFGAYTPEFTFFMDGGTQSWADSAESVTACINAAADKAQLFSPDFMLFQEVDTDSTRSYHINQGDILKKRFSSYNYDFAVNYHSAFLMYPFNQPHGASNSGIMTVSSCKIDSAMRRSLPISTGLSKFLDLDRCYSVSRLPTENGRELVIYNVHMSAYGGSDEIRAAQMNMLFSDMKSEYDAGNYCICGGDFNHDFTGDSNEKLNGETVGDFGWAQPFPTDLLPEGISRCIDYSGKLNPTCRNCDIPYEEGNFTVIVDGFLVSDNVEVSSVRNINTGFVYSDHNPVVLSFSLLP